MLYAFLLDADPSGCSLEEQAQRRLDLKLGAAPEQHADIALELCEPALAGDRRTRPAQALRRNRTAAGRACWRAWSAPASASTAPSCSASPRLMETEIARLTAEIHALAGKPFNISSPQQLGKVLFEDLELPAPVQVRQGQDRSPPPPTCWRSWPPITRSCARCWSTGSSPSSRAPTWMRCRADRLRDRAPAHQLQPDRRRHRTALLLEPEPAEHPDPHRARPRDPRRLRAARGLEAAGGGLLADRAAAAGAHVGRRAAGGGVPQRRGHPHAHRGRGVRRAADDGHAGGAPRAPRRSTSASSTASAAFGLAAQLGISRAEAEQLHQELLRALRRREALHRRDHRGSARRRA